MKNILKKIITFILKTESKLVLLRYKPKIIAVTGSVGKTSTKDAIYTALKNFVHVRKTAKSYNSEIGIPLTILGLPNGWNNVSVWFRNIIKGFLMIIKKQDYPKYLILEIGADHPGEIRDAMKWIHPDISIITRIGDVPVHVEFYRSQKEVWHEKSFLARGLKNDGLLVLNSDDEDVIEMKNLTKARFESYGIDNKADVKASFVTALYDENQNVFGINFKVDIGGKSIPVSLENIIGKQHVYPALASFVVAKELGLDLLKVANSFSNHEYPRGRMNIIKGKKDSIIIDDTYNASPVAVEEGIKTIDAIESKGRKIAVIGDMLELGRFSDEEHRRIGAMIPKVFDNVVGVGVRTKDLLESALENKMAKTKITWFANSVEAGEFLNTKLKKGDLVYVKGSQGTRMERVVASIIEDESLIPKLLVRQDKEWQERN